MKKMRKFTPQQIIENLRHTLPSWSVLNNYNKNCITYEIYEHMPDYLQWTHCSVPYVPGMYVKYTAKKPQILFEGTAHLQYSEPKKYKAIKDAYDKAFGHTDIRMELGNNFINKNGIAPHIQIIVTNLVSGAFILKGIEAYMRQVGYFCGISFDADDVQNGVTYKIFQYEPYRYRNEIFNIPEYLYHVAPEHNVRSIKRNGLKPSVSDKHDFEYPGRVYCFDVLDPIKFMRLVKASKNFKKFNNQINFSVFEIDTDKIDAVFFSDPNMLENAVYTYDSIPVSSFNRIISDSIITK